MNIKYYLEDYFKFELSKIQTPEVRESVLLLFEYAPEYVTSIESASTSRYSRTSSGEVVSLLEHTKEVTRYMLLFMSNPLICQGFTAKQIDIMIASCLVHDLAKRGTLDSPEDYNRFDHPILVCSLIPQEVLNTKYSHLAQTVYEIYRVCSAHNGLWNTNKYSQVELPVPTDNMQFYVHICDWIASRQCTSMSLSEDNNYILKEFERQWILPTK